MRRIYPHADTLSAWEIKELEIENLRLPSALADTRRHDYTSLRKPVLAVSAAKCSDATVLIVDDDEYFRALARAILEPGGFEVIEADGVATCLAAVRTHAVDAIILDMVMPDRDGIEALRELKTLYPGTKVLTVSGVNGFGTVFECFGVPRRRCFA